MNTSIRNILIGIYVLVVLGISAAAKADYKILPYPTHQQAVKYVGTIAQTVDGDFYLIIDAENEMYFQVYGNIDFAQFNGQQVKVIGIESVMRQVGPVLSVASYDPLNEEVDESVVAPKLHVLSINGIAPQEQ